MNLIGLSVYVSTFFSATKSPSFMKFWAKLKHDEARFLKFLFLRGSPYGPVLKIGPLSVVHFILSHLKMQVHENLALWLFFGPL